MCPCTYTVAAKYYTQDDQEWPVEQLLAKRHRRGVTEYLVKWLGFTIDHNSWEPEHYISRPRS